MLKLYDTLTRTEKEVAPEDGETLRFYCCGPTVYGPAHIGNFRTFIMQDFFRRVAELSGLKTKHVRNLTDVDDKTIRESMAAGKSLSEFTAMWTKVFHDDCAALRLLPPHVEPSAVEHIPEQIALIEKLMASGNAYQGKDGSIYFSVSSFERYGKLSHLDEREIRLGSADTAHDADEYEKDSLADFALWKAHKEEDGSNAWESPWGKGRPGWHLECSAMGLKYLGETFDMHSGGADLCFPHHENEIAQSEAATGKEFVRHWFHGAMLRVEGEKMSKSLGNLYTLKELEERGFTADEVRYTLLSGNYRQPLNFTFDTMHAARKGMQRLAQFAEKLMAAAGVEAFPTYDEVVAASALERASFQSAWDALQDDLNAPEALGRVFSAVKAVESRLPGMAAGEAKSELMGFASLVAAFGWALPEAGGGGSGEEAPEEILGLAKQRWEAKQAKDWAEADRLRDEVAAAGWVIKDGPEGYEVVKG